MGPEIEQPGKAFVVRFCTSLSGGREVRNSHGRKKNAETEVLWLLPLQIQSRAVRRWDYTK